MTTPPPNHTTHFRTKAQVNKRGHEPKPEINGTHAGWWSLSGTPFSVDVIGTSSLIGFYVIF